MYKNFCKIYDILEVLSSYLDYAHDCMNGLFKLGDNSIKYDKYTGKTTIVIEGETYLITDTSLLPYVVYDYYVANYDNMFDDSLDFYHTFLFVCCISFKDMASNLDSIVGFVATALTVYGIETQRIQFLHLLLLPNLLQQRLPFTVLKLVNLIERRGIIFSCESISSYSIESCMLNRG